MNNWEGTYFNFNGEKLVEMAKEAAGLGVELFVMDDGWFGKRDSDESGLGDWYVNEQKLGCTLAELSDKIHSYGLKFGIWFEPECISEDSDLYRSIRIGHLSFRADSLCAEDISLSWIFPEKRYGIISSTKCAQY